MKPGPISKAHFQSVPSGSTWDGVKDASVDNPFSFQHFTVPQPMPQQEVAPPPYLWDRIANVLDEQDRRKVQAQVAFAPSTKKVQSNHKYILYAAIIMLVGAVILSLI